MKPGVASSQAMSEVDVIIRDLKAQRGFSSYMIMNNDGIIIKYDNVEYRRALHIAGLVLDLACKAKGAVRDLLEPHENDVESMRIKTRDYELIVGQSGNFTLVVVQQQGHQMPSVAAQPLGSVSGKKSDGIVK